jgi:glutamate/tyrosine decarboxylase-like PLP-dependent enzyme
VSGDGERMHRIDEDFVPIANAVLRYAVERIRMDPPPLDGPRSPEELVAAAGTSITPGGIGGEEALRRWVEVLAPACISQDNPRALSFVPAAPTEAAVLFDLVVGASSIYAGSWLEGGGAVHAENEALRWLADLAGMPAGSGGCFVSGGSAGNLAALVTARHRAAGTRARPERWLVATSSEVHSSVTAAARVIDVDVLDVLADDDGRMTGDRLEAAIAAHERGADVFGVVATAGTTNAGRIDDLAGAAAVCRRRGLWLHVDGAYGGAALVVPEMRERFAGIEHADSLVIDPHKWLFSPFDCAALVYRDPAIAREVFAQHADYLAPIQERGDWNPSDYAFHLSRRARGLPFWFSLAAHGTDAYRDAIARTVETAQTAARLVDDAEHVQLVMEPGLSIVLFRRVGWGPDEYRGWSERALEEGITLTVPTTHRGETVLRWCFVNPRTTADDVRAIIDSLR